MMNDSDDDSIPPAQLHTKEMKMNLQQEGMEFPQLHFELSW